MSNTVETTAHAEASGLRAIQAKVVVAATFGGALSPTPALLTVYGLVMVPIAEEFGWPRAQVAGVDGRLHLLAA